MIEMDLPICGESQHCIYQDGTKRVRVCKVLYVKKGAPYPDGKCKFFKAKKTDKSGYREGIREEEMVWKPIKKENVNTT